MAVQVPGRVDDRRTDVGDEDGVVIRELVDDPRDVLRVDGPAPLGGHGELVKVLAGALVVLDRLLEVGAALVLLQHRQQRPHGLGHVPEERQVQRRALAQLLTAHVDLDDLRVLRVELPIREVRAEHEDGVGLLHRPVAGGEAEQPRQPDVEGVVSLHVLLAPEGVHHGRGEGVGQPEHLALRPLGADPDEQRGALRGVQQVRGRADLVLVRRDARPGPVDDGDPVVQRLGLGDVTRHDEHRHAPLLNGRPHRGLQHPRHLVGGGDHLAVDAALLEEVLRVGLLEVPAADLGAGDLRGDREHRHPRALGVEETVDQVQVARAAAAEADGQIAGQLRLGCGGEGTGLLVADELPVEVPVPAHRFGEAVEGVTGHAVGVADPVGPQGGDDVVRDRGHVTSSSLLGVSRSRYPLRPRAGGPRALLE